MKRGAVVLLLWIGVSIACGGNSPTAPNPSPPPAPPPTVRGTWVEAPPTTIGEVAANPNVGNTIPFGSNSVAGPSFAATTYQQVYLGSLFGTSQIRLTSIQFPIQVSPTGKPFASQPPLDVTFAGCVAAATAAVLRGAHILRVHQVGELRAAAVVADQFLRS